MPYLDKEEKFYDYRTAEVDGEDIFDLNRGSNPDADSILKDKDNYWKNEKNTISEIVYMSPKEYFTTCAKDCFNEPVEKLIDSRRRDKDTAEHLKQVLFDYKKRFPLPYIDYATHYTPSQEGLHRMMVAGDLFGWDTKFPVQIIKWADDDRAKKEKEWKHSREIERYLKKAIDRALRYKYYNIEELEDQLKSEFEQEVRYVDEFEDREIKLSLYPQEDGMIEVVVDDKYKSDFDSSHIDFLEPTGDSEDDLEDLDWDDLSDWMKELLGINESMIRREFVNIEDYLLSDQLDNDLKAEFGENYSNQPLCKEICEYIKSHCPSCEVLRFCIGVWKENNHEVELISNKGHCVIKYQDSLYDFTSDQYNHYGITKKKSQPRVLEYDASWSDIFGCPVYRDENYLISTY